MKRYRVIVPIEGEAIAYIDAKNNITREEVDRIIKELYLSDFHQNHYLKFNDFEYEELHKVEE